MPFEIENPKFSVAGVEVDLNDLPARSIRALISRGWNHYFSSEQASKVKSWKDKKAEEGVEVAEDELAAYKAECVAQALEALRAGSIGTRAAGVSIDPMDKLRQKIAKQQVLDILRKNDIKVPKKDAVVTFKNGTTKTLEEMVATRLQVNGEAIEAEAKKALAARTKQVAALPQGETAEDLGL